MRARGEAAQRLAPSASDSASQQLLPHRPARAAAAAAPCAPFNGTAAGPTRGSPLLRAPHFIISFTRALAPQTGPPPPPPRARSGRFPVWAVGRCSERAFPGAGSEGMLGAGAPQCQVTGGCSERAFPGAGSQGMLEGAEMGTRGRGCRQPRARRREPPAPHLQPCRRARAPSPQPPPGGTLSRRRKHGNNGGTGATGPTARSPSGRRYLPQLSHAATSSFHSERRRRSEHRPHTLRQSNPGRSKHRPPHIPPPAALPGPEPGGKGGAPELLSGADAHSSRGRI